MKAPAAVVKAVRRVGWLDLELICLARLALLRSGGRLSSRKWVRRGRTYHVLLAFFSFRISLVAHWLSVLVFVILDRRP